MFNICFLVSSYYPSTGGVQKITRALCEAIALDGNGVTVLTTKENRNNDEEIINSVFIKRFDIKIKNSIVYGQTNELNQYLIDNQHSFDILVYVCFDSPVVVASLCSIKWIKVKKILYMHGLTDHKLVLRKLFSRDVFQYLKNLIRINFLLKKYHSHIGCFDAVVNLSSKDSAYQFFKSKYKMPIYELNNFVDEACFRLESKNTSTNKTITYVANYYPLKNQTTILEAIYKSEAVSSCVFIGAKKTDYYNRLIERNTILSKSKGVDKALFLVDIPRSEVIKILHGTYVFAMSSKAEMFPLVICEAMASGVPFVCSDVGVVSTFPGGIIVDNNPTEFAQAFDKLIMDEELYSALSKQGILYAQKHFRKEVFVKNFYKLLSDQGIQV